MVLSIKIFLGHGPDSLKAALSVADEKFVLKNQGPCIICAFNIIKLLTRIFFFRKTSVFIPYVWSFQTGQLDHCNADYPSVIEPVCGTNNVTYVNR